MAEGENSSHPMSLSFAALILNLIRGTCILSILFVTLRMGTGDLSVL